MANGNANATLTRDAVLKRGLPCFLEIAQICNRYRFEIIVFTPPELEFSRIEPLQADVKQEYNFLGRAVVEE